MKRSFLFILILLLLSFGQISWADDYPTKPITIIVPMPPGGNLDVQARAFTSIAEKILGKPFVIMNKPGASGMIGGLAGAQAPADGHTLTIGTPAIINSVEWEIVNGRKPPFTMQNDFAPIASYSLSPGILIVNADSPWKTLADFVRDVKAKPDFYAYSTFGRFSGSHVSTLALTRAAGLNCRHVPVSGGASATASLLGKHVDFSTQFPTMVLPLVEGKKVRGLATLSQKRCKFLPEVPTAKEQGFEAEAYGWASLMVPKRTPEKVVQKLRDVARIVSKDKDFINIMENSGNEVDFMTGDELMKFWNSQSENIRKIMTEIQIEEGKSK